MSRTVARAYSDPHHAALFSTTKQETDDNAMVAGMEHMSEADAVRNLAPILQRVQSGLEVIIERHAQPLAVIRAAAPARPMISESIALAEAHKKETGQAPVLDPGFAADVEEIVRNRKPWNSPTWD